MTQKTQTKLGPIVAISLVILAVVAFFGAREMFNPTAKTSGTIPIGGAFTLTDHNAKTVTDKDFLGSYMMVYFGYTYCPDVCPTSLGLMGHALDILAKEDPKQAARIQPIFVSVDPERDTVAVLKEYAPNFHPRLLGLTGTVDQVKEAANAYRVYFAKVVEKDAKPGEYLMDHSSITYVIGPDGKFVTHFGHGTAADVMAKKLAELP